MLGDFLHFSFKRPKLLGVGKNPPSRNATPLELFFDLAFVVSMAHLMGILESSLTYNTLLYVILKFIAIFIFWNLVTMYNQYFEDNTVVHRLIIFGAMIPILLLSTEGDKVTINLLWIYTFSFIISRLYIILIWFWATFKKKNPYLKRLVRIYYLKNIYSLIIVVISICFLATQRNDLWIISWIIALSLEIIYPIVMIKRLNRNVDFESEDIPVFDRKLQMERTTLFTILILGEGLVGTTHLISEAFSGHYDFFIKAFILFLVTFMVLWIYIDYYTPYTVKIDYFLSLNYLNIFQVLGSFLIMAGFITLFDNSEYISQVIIAIGLILFSVTNMIIDRHRGEFILDKYEYSDIAFTGEEQFDFRSVKRSFILNLILSFVLLIFKFNIYIVSALVITVLSINIILLIKTWYKYAS